MTDVIFPHSYTNTSCLQVFLYTNVDHLFKEAALALSQATHQEPLFAIVPGYEQKEALLNQYYKKNGFTNFVEIGTFPEIIKIILQKYYGYKQPQIHDVLSLTFAIYELILKKDPSVSFLNLSDFSIEDTYNLAKQIAHELVKILSINPDIDNKKICDLISATKKLYPDFFFEKEGLEVCFSTLNRCVFIGFHFLPIYYLELLKKTESKAFFLVPSLSFLGDILTPKQRLKILRKDQDFKNLEFSFTEHPLLEQLSFEQKLFFQKLVEVDQLSIDDFIEIKDEPTALDQFKRSIIYGSFEENLYSDESIKCFEVDGLYKQAILFFNQLQKNHVKDLTLDQGDILIIGDKYKYEPIFDAISNVLLNEDSKLNIDNKNVSLILIKLMNNPYSAQDQNFFIDFFTSLSAFCSDELKNAVECSLLVVKNLHLGGGNPLLKGNELLKEITNSLLRANLFDIDEVECSYEFNFLKNIESIDLDRIHQVFYETCDLIETIENLRKKVFSIEEWLVEWGEIVNKKRVIYQFDYNFISKLIRLFPRFSQKNIAIPWLAFIDIVKNFCFDEFQTKRELFKFSTLESIISFRPKISVIFLSSEDHKSKVSFFDVQIQPFNFCLYYLLNTESQLIVIKNRDNKKQSLDLIKGIWAVLTTYFKKTDFEKEIKADLLNVAVSKKEFFNNIAIREFEQKDIQAANSTLELDFIKKFIADPVDFFKTKILKIISPALMDLEVKERYLLSYQLQLECNKLEKPIKIDEFKSLNPHDHEKLVFFSKNVEVSDVLTTMRIVKADEILINQQCKIELVGLSNYENLNKIYKKPEKINLLLKIKNSIY